MVQISGENFPENLTQVLLGNKTVEIVSSNQTNIVILSPSLAPGEYSLFILTSIGYSK